MIDDFPVTRAVYPMKMQTERPSTDIRVLLFDVGGVLVQLNSIEAVLGGLGNTMTAEELWHKWLRSEVVRRFETGRIDAAEFAIGVTREFHIEIEPQRFLDAFAGWPIGLFPDTVSMLARIPGSHRRAVLSNSNAVHWPRMYGEMRIGELFDHRFVSHLTGLIKPDEDSFEQVVRSLDCRAEQVLFLDDNSLNVEAAAKFGMHAVRVQGPAQAERALIGFGIIDTVS